MTVSTEAFVQLSDVKRALLRSDADDELGEEVFTDGGTYDEEGVDGIESASIDVRDYLHRDLYVQKWTPLLASSDWKKVKRTPDSDYPYQLELHRVPDWPILDVTQDVKIHEQKRIFAKTSTDFDTLTIYAGYGRSDLGAQDYGVDNQLSDSDIPEFPEKILQVVKRISIYYAFRQIKGLIGVRSETQMFGEWQTEVQKETHESDYVHRQLKTLHTYRSL